MHTRLQVSYLTAECKALFIQVVEFLKESKKVKRRMKGKQQNRRNHKFKKKRFRGKKKKSIDLGKRKVGKEEAEG
jgi:phosphorylcholine metabolism protein LicD